MPYRLFAVAVIGISLIAGTSHASDNVQLLHVFPKYQGDGMYPAAGLISDSNGNLYGTTSFGGSGNVADGGAGTVFELSLGTGKWKERVIYNFSGGTDGGAPMASLIFDSKGNLYGATYGGGNPACGCGVVFELSPRADGTWSETVLHQFGNQGQELNQSWGPLTFDTKGNLYGTAASGGMLCGCGGIFELTPQANGKWKYSDIYLFTGAQDGGNPESRLIFDSEGNLYGAAGTAVFTPVTIFELTPTSGRWQFQLLATLPGCGACDQYGVMSAPTFDTKGNLFGTITVGGRYGYGYLYEVYRQNGSWTWTTLHDFTGGHDGGFPYTAPLFDSKGNMYGATYGVGTVYGSSCGFPCNGGTVWQLVPGEGGQWTMFTLHVFGDTEYETQGPIGDVLMNSTGSLIGATFFGPAGYLNNWYGTVFELTPQ